MVQSRLGSPRNLEKTYRRRADHNLPPLLELAPVAMLAENRTLACTQPSPTYVTHGAQKTKENRNPNLGTGYKLWSKISSEVPIIFKKHKGGDQMTPENERK